MQAYTARQGIRLHHGTVLGATLNAAPTSNQSRTEPRDPEMQSTLIVWPCYFGLNLLIGIHYASGLIHQARQVLQANSEQGLLNSNSQYRRWLNSGGNL